MEINNLETRSFNLTLGQAKDWFKSGEDILKTLALSVFSEDELANPYCDHFNLNKYNGFTLVRHQKTTYAGIIYFNYLTDLKKTIDMLGNDIKYLL